MAKIWCFWCNLYLVFLAEIGDKTQIATVALAARYDSIFWVMLDNNRYDDCQCTAVFIGNKLAERLPISLIHKIGAAIFLIVGISTLIQYYFF